MAAEGPKIPTHGKNAFSQSEAKKLRRALEYTDREVDSVVFYLKDLIKDYEKDPPQRGPFNQRLEAALAEVFSIEASVWGLTQSSLSDIERIILRYQSGQRTLKSSKTRFRRREFPSASWVAQAALSDTGIPIDINMPFFFPEDFGTHTKHDEDDWRNLNKLDRDLMRAGVLIHEAIHKAFTQFQTANGELGHFCTLGAINDPYGYQKFLWAKRFLEFGTRYDLSPPKSEQCKTQHSSWRRRDGLLGPSGRREPSDFA